MKRLNIELPGDQYQFLKNWAETKRTSLVGAIRQAIEVMREDWDESEWLRAAASNPAFDFLKEREEDIYTLADGKPFYDQP